MKMPGDDDCESTDPTNNNPNPNPTNNNPNPNPTTNNPKPNPTTNNPKPNPNWALGDDYEIQILPNDIKELMRLMAGQAQEQFCNHIWVSKFDLAKEAGGATHTEL